MTSFARPTDLLSGAGSEIGVSRWITIGQERINQFAQSTEDDQWIHVDADRARTGPFQTTIAHGYLTLSLASTMLTEVVHVGAVEAALNYGVNKVRFPAPVPVDGKVRGHVRLVSATRRGEMIEATYGLTVELDGATKPACVAELVVLYR